MENETKKVVEKKDGVFQERLNKLIKESGKSQKDLADYVGITRQSISLYAAGKRTPDIDILKEICDFFQVSADYLLGINDLRGSDIDNKEINRRLGLSDKAIKTLENYQEFFKNRDKKVLIPIINYLIENEDMPMPEYQTEYMNSIELEKMLFETKRHDMLEVAAQKKLKILSSIETYFMVTSEKNDYYEQVVESLGWDPNERSYRQLLERTYLQNIEDCLRVARITYLFDNKL